MKKIKISTLVILLMLSLKVSGQVNDPFIGQIMWVPYNFTPKNWAQCNGQLLPISQNTALFSLLGTQSGGNGQTTFALPDMQGRTMMGDSDTYPVGTKNGVANITLITGEMPNHTHNVKAVKIEGNKNLPTSNFHADTKTGDPEYSDATANTTMSPTMVTPSGDGQPHNNMQPYGTLKCIIALQGVFPQRP